MYDCLADPFLLGSWGTSVFSYMSTFGTGDGSQIGSEWPMPFTMAVFLSPATYFSGWPSSLMCHSPPRYLDATEIFPMYLA